MTFRAAFYKGTRPGLPGVYNRLVRARTRGDYSHCELIFSDGWSASASYMDHGVRFKWIEYDPAHWDIIELPGELEAHARQFFLTHEGDGYDLLGNFHLALGFISESQNKQFCSEAIAAALQIPDAWRLDPNTLAAVLRWRYLLA